MWFFYFFAIIPVAVGAVLWVKDKEVTWWEWLAGSGIALLMAIVFHLISFYSMTSDVETWSGRVTSATFHPWWKERYTETETYTTGSGKNAQTHTRTVTKYREHHEHWSCETTLGGGGAIDVVGMTFGGISQAQYDVIRRKFECDPVKTHVWKSGLCAGDPNIYVVRNKSGHLIPVTDTRRWTNKVQASPSVFQFAQVPSDVGVYDYPENPSMWMSGRLLGSAKCLGIYEWDQMNSRLGPTKKVNVIMVGFSSGDDQMMGQWQEAKWLGGKKNDLVITYAGNPGMKPQWVYTFGWTEQEIVKRNIDAIVGKSVIDKDLIPLIEEEVRDNYIIKDWDKFDYLGIEPPGWAYFVFILVMLAAQGGFYYFAHMNEYKTREGW